MWGQSKESIQSVFQLVTSPSEDEPYTALKVGLLHNHQLTDYQRIEKLHVLDGLGSRKPTQLLSEMMALCPQGEQQSKFFAFLFLHRLPNWLRIMLEEDDHQDGRSLAVKADKLQALYGHLQHGTVAAVDSPDWAVNAVKGSSRGGKGGYDCGRGQGSSKPQRGGRHSGAGQSADGAANTAAAAGPSPAALFRTPPVYVIITGLMETRPQSVGPPAAGREIKPPGASQRRRPRQAGPYRRPVIRKAFSGRHGGGVQHISSPLIRPAHRSSSHGSQRPAY
jgi:hypothetical protein